MPHSFGIGERTEHCDCRSDASGSRVEPYGQSERTSLKPLDHNLVGGDAYHLYTDTEYGESERGQQNLFLDAENRLAEERGRYDCVAEVPRNGRILD